MINQARDIRKIFIDMHYKAKSGHIGTGLSCIDLLTYIYGYYLKPDDKFILSKGHGASALYATLNYFGKIDKQLLDTYYKDGTILPAHPAPNKLKDIPIATGSLGHGLPVAVGIAYAEKYLNKNNNKIVCMLSDGECNEGSNWEAIMFAGHYKLDNLIIIVDANKLQGFGATKDIINIMPLCDKLLLFGYNTMDIDGHNFEHIENAFLINTDKPKFIVAHTIKGKGISFMENKLEWHYLFMNDDQYQTAVDELEYKNES